MRISSVSKILFHRTDLNNQDLMPYLVATSNLLLINVLCFLSTQVILCCKNNLVSLAYPYMKTSEKNICSFPLNLIQTNRNSSSTHKNKTQDILEFGRIKKWECESFNSLLPLLPFPYSLKRWFTSCGPLTKKHQITQELREMQILRWSQAVSIRNWGSGLQYR